MTPVKVAQGCHACITNGNCSFVVTTAGKDLRDLLRRVDDDFVQNQRSNENGVGGVVAILTLTNEAVAKAVKKRSQMVKKNCTIEPNVSRHYFHAIKNDRGAILYSFIPIDVLHAQKYVQCSVYGNACEIFNAYNIQVPPVDPKLRQFNVGFWFQPNGTSKWDDDTPYSKELLPGFPLNMPQLTEYSCVNLDIKTGKPVMGDCALLYDVVVCEQRCVSLGYLTGTFAA
ncbi:unnamed protein product [Toxocara canis]|uniref:Crinkler (CRN) family protein n=1 Tax=Toxocara canis TaxID=6265 RepID=A0A183VBR2_TOXCA|nr:unnamed protein product [Toxocara canis]